MRPSYDRRPSDATRHGLLALAGFVALALACSGSDTPSPTAGCFLFPSGDRQGFTFDGIYDGDATTQIAEPGCDPSAIDLSIGGSPNWSPTTTDDGTRSIWTFLSPGCFPDAAPSGFVRFDYVSPDLSSDPEWRGATGFRFQSLANIDGVSAQAIARVRMASGRETFFASQAFPQVGTSPAQGWTQDQVLLPDSVAAILDVRARLFVDPDGALEYPGTESAVWVDGVCPIE